MINKRVYAMYIDLANKLVAGISKGYSKADRDVAELILHADYEDSPRKKVQSVETKTYIPTSNSGSLSQRIINEGRSKRFDSSINYDYIDQTVLRHFEAECFTIAGVTTFELEEQLKQIARQNIEARGNLASYRREVSSIIDTHAAILKTNYNTAFNASYHAGEYIRLQRNKDLFPAYRYKTVDDDRVRLSHAAVHNVIYMASDPIWDTLWPPNGWNCRCFIEPLTRKELITAGGAVDTNDAVAKKDTLDKAQIEKEFQRNAAQTKSIFDKWLKQKYSQEHITEVKTKLADYVDTVRYEGISPVTPSQTNASRKAMAIFPEDSAKTKFNEIWLDEFGTKTFIIYNSAKTATFKYIIMADAGTTTGTAPISQLKNYRKGFPCI